MKWCGSHCGSPARDEHVFATVIPKRLSIEGSEESLQLETSDIEEPEPFVLRCPPERAGAAGGTDSRSAPLARRAKMRAYRLRVSRARSLRRLRACAPARASPAKSRFR